jgi:hypothetical protein
MEKLNCHEKYGIINELNCMYKTGREKEGKVERKKES